MLDTAYPGPGKTYYHITELPRGVNSNANDNQLTFIHKGGKYEVLLSSDRSGEQSGIQRLFSTVFLTSTKYDPLLNLDDVNLPLPIGAAFYSEADQKLYFSGKAANTDPNDYDLFVASLAIRGDAITLQTVTPIAQLNKQRFFDAQPALTPDGKTIYFVSDRDSGAGGTDIWYATRSNIQSQDWTEPQPVPGEINTPCDELSPFVTKDGNTFYFSSNGHETVGGYDLFRATKSGSRSWSTPQNLGMPINTKEDEIFPVALNDTAFFYTSNQPSALAGMNIYTITRSNIALSERTKPTNPLASNEVKEPGTKNSTKETKEVLDTGTVTVAGTVLRERDSVVPTDTRVFWRDAQTAKELGEKKVDRNGEFSIDLKRGKVYDIGAESGSTFYDLMRLDLRHEADSIVRVTLKLPDTLTLRINFPFDDYSHPTKFVIGDNGEELSVTWQQSLDMAARSINAVAKNLQKIILIGHTDSLGTDEYNDRLGLNRAKFVTDQLVARGVRRSLIEVRSMGRRSPVAKRPEESDEIYRLRCRRVEFIKVYKDRK